MDYVFLSRIVYFGLPVTVAVALGFRLSMCLIPARFVYSIQDDHLRPGFFNSAAAWHAPAHVLSPLGRRLRFFSDAGFIGAGILMALLGLLEWQGLVEPLGCD